MNNYYNLSIDNQRRVLSQVASKTFLLHELFSIEGLGKEASRKSRHLYDLFKMMDKDFAIEAVKNEQLWESIRHHREIFTSVKGIDYTPDVRKRLTLIPRVDIRAIWEDDYNNMGTSMIFGEKPPFSVLLKKMEELENRFHNSLENTTVAHLR